MSLFSCNCKCVKISLNNTSLPQRNVNSFNALTNLHPRSTCMSKHKNHEHGKKPCHGRARRNNDPRESPKGMLEWWNVAVQHLREVTNFQIGGVSAQGNTSSKISWNKFNKLRLFEAQVHCRCWCQWNVSRSLFQFSKIVWSQLEYLDLQKNIGPNFDLHLSALTPP